MKKRICIFLTALILAVCLCVSALAVSYPVMRGAVNDDAAVLSDSTAQDIETLNQRGDTRFTVVTRHFLGGADAQQYCSALFDAWGLGDDDFLLLLVIGEERYAAAMGSHIAGVAFSEEQLSSLFSAKLRPLFLQERDYDGAVGSFLLAASAQIARAQGETINTAGLFGSTQQSATSQQNSNSSSSGSWFTSWTGNNWSGFFSDSDLNDFTQGAEDYEYEGGSGFSVGKMILIVAVILIILRNRHRKGKSGLGAAGFVAAGMGAKEVMRGMNGGHGGPRPPKR